VLDPERGLPAALIAAASCPAGEAGVDAAGAAADEGAHHEHARRVLDEDEVADVRRVPPVALRVERGAGEGAGVEGGATLIVVHDLVCGAAVAGRRRASPRVEASPTPGVEAALIPLYVGLRGGVVVGEADLPLRERPYADAAVVTDRDADEFDEGAVPRRRHVRPTVVQLNTARPGDGGVGAAGGEEAAPIVVPDHTQSGDGDRSGGARD